MTIAITGATGQLGSLVVDALLEQVPADQVVAVVRDAAKAQSLADRGVTVRVAPYDDRAALETAFAGVDKVLLVSGNEFGQRAQQHANVIDAAQAAGVGFLAYTSVLGGPATELLVTPEHVETEQYLAQSGLPHSLLRNGWYHENYVPAIDAARHTGTVLTAAGDGLVASASRRDYAEAAAAVLLADDVQPVYELSGDVAWSQEDLAAALADVIGSPVTVTRTDEEGLRSALLGAGVPDVWAGFNAATDVRIAAGDLAATPGELTKLIGRPTTPLVDTLRALA